MVSSRRGHHHHTAKGSASAASTAPAAMAPASPGDARHATVAALPPELVPLRVPLAEDCAPLPPLPPLPPPPPPPLLLLTPGACTVKRAWQRGQHARERGGLTVPCLRAR